MGFTGSRKERQDEGKTEKVEFTNSYQEMLVNDEMSVNTLKEV